MPSSFPSQDSPNEYKAVQGEIYQFQGAELQADHPPEGDSSNKVATTGWVASELSGNDLVPTVSQAGNLLVQVSDGIVNKPNGDTCVINNQSPLGVNASVTEYIWVRYSDCSIVASTIMPSATIGRVLATVVSNATEIISISNSSNVLGWAPTVDPVFSGDPKAPHPPKGDDDNSLATTGWVQNELYGLIFGYDRPRLSISPPSTVTWTEGTLDIPNNEVLVNSGSYTFPSTADGVYFAYGVNQGGSGIIEIKHKSEQAPNFNHIFLNRIYLNNGVIEGLSLPPMGGFGY